MISSHYLGRKECPYHYVKRNFEKKSSGRNSNQRKPPTIPRNRPTVRKYQLQFARLIRYTNSHHRHTIRHRRTANLASFTLILQCQHISRSPLASALSSVDEVCLSPPHTPLPPPCTSKHLKSSQIRISGRSLNSFPNRSEENYSHGFSACCAISNCRRPRHVV
jgi:hypothetical protein